MYNLYIGNISTQYALLHTNELIYRQMDSHKLILLHLLDFSKAFDSVEHRILLSKLQNLGIHPERFRSYLDNRTQAGSLQNYSSSLMKKYVFGVPQGSILG